MHTGKIKQAVAAPHMPPSPVSKGAAPPASAAPALKAPVTPSASPATAGYKNVGQTFTPTPVAKPAAPAITAAPATQPVAQPATQPAAKPPQFDQFTEALRGQRYGNTFGTQLDPKSQETQKYWQNYQQQLAAAQQGGQPLSADNEWMLDPKVVAQKYILDAEKNRINTEHAESQGAMPFLQRLFGFRRGVNSGMDEQITVDDNIGQNPNGLSGAAVNTLAAPIGGAAVAGSIIDQALTGDDQSAVRSGVGRDNVSLINHLLGIDLGHDVNLRGDSDLMYDAKGGLKDVFTHKDKATSPGFMGDVYDPLTQSVKPSTLNASKNMARYHAKNTDEDIPLYDRIAAGAYANAADALPYVGAGAGAHRLTALSPLAKSLTTAPAASELWPAVSKFLPGVTKLPQFSAAAAGIPTLLDPTSNDGITDRLTNTLRDAGNAGTKAFNVNPAWAAAQPLADASGVQDYANIGANWVRNNVSPSVNSAVNAVLPTDGNNKDVGELLANTVSGAPGMIPALFTGALSPSKWKSNLPAVKEQALTNLKQTGKFTGVSGATNTLLNHGNEPDGSEPLPVAEQQQQTMLDSLMAMKQQRQDQGLPKNNDLRDVIEERLPEPTPPPVPVMPAGGELSADGAGAPSATTPPATETQVQPTPAAAKTTALEILPTAPAIEEYAQTNPEQAQVMQQTAGDQLQTAAKTQDGQAQLKSLNETGDLTPEAHETVKYNLLNDGFDSEEIGKWYNKLEGPEKFALWGGLSMTMLGLIQALNGGGAGSWITTLLGLGTAGLAAGSTGLLGDQAQDMSQKVTKPVGEAVGGFTNSVANSVLSNPTALKALAPMLEHLPDNAVKALQAKIREVAPDKAEQLDAATAGGFFFGGMRRDTGIEALQTQLGLSPEQAGRFLDLWAQKS